MKNFLGGSNEDIFGMYPAALEEDSRAKIHFYGKGVRAGRKIGHVNIGGKSDQVEELRQAATRVANILSHGTAEL